MTCIEAIRRLKAAIAFELDKSKVFLFHIPRNSTHPITNTSMSNTPAAAKVESNGRITVLSSTGGVICTISPSYGKAISASVNGKIVSSQTDQGYIVIHEISGSSSIFKSAKK